jgi:hypothetical protein
MVIIIILCNLRLNFNSFCQLIMDTSGRAGICVFILKVQHIKLFKGELITIDFFLKICYLLFFEAI